MVFINFHFVSSGIYFRLRERGNGVQRTRLGDGGALSCVTLGRLPLNDDKKLSINCCSVAFCQAGTEVQQSSQS